MSTGAVLMARGRGLPVTRSKTLHDFANDWTPAARFCEDITRDALLQPQGGSPLSIGLRAARLDGAGCFLFDRSTEIGIEAGPGLDLSGATPAIDTIQGRLVQSHLCIAWGRK